MNAIHPKTSGAALGSALGVMLSAILHSIHGIHLDASSYAAITAFLGTLGSWLAPAPATTGPINVTPVTGNQASSPTPVAAPVVTPAPTPVATPVTPTPIPPVTP